MNMGTPTKSSESVSCDFCGERTAVLFCRADTAKLCLLCDQHVHAANLLSRKHVRSQICDNCSKEPVSIRCFTDNLVLCQECDWDVHGSCSVSALHVRSAVEGFSGCPSAHELATMWGLDLKPKKGEEEEVPLMMENFGLSLDSWISGNNGVQELVVPNEFKKQSLSCGKYKQVVYKQLEDLLNRDLVIGNGNGNDSHGGGGGGGGGAEIIVPGMPESFGWSGDLEGNNGRAVMTQHPGTPSFTSLLMYPVEQERGSGGGTQWNANNLSGGQNSQIWDFHSGRSRGPEEPSRVESGYETKDASFTIKNFTDLMNESFPINAKRFPDTCRDDSNHSTSGPGPATSESNNLPNNSKDIQFTDQFVGSSSSSKTTRVAATKAHLKLLAQNRGNAMQRYKEKKKNRKYDKTIRYESRKTRADTRMRVKGRFVKASEAPFT